MIMQADVHRPPDHLIDCFGTSFFHWWADCPHTKGMANPHPRSPFPCKTRYPQQAFSTKLGCALSMGEGISSTFCQAWGSNKVLSDLGASIHLSGALCFASHMRPFFPFRIFFADSSSAILVMQMTTLRLPVKNGTVVVQDVAYSKKSRVQFYQWGVVPVFDDLVLSLFVSGFTVTTTFSNNCWWLDALSAEGTKGLASVTPSNSLSSFEINPISHPSTMSLNSCEWNERLGQACYKMVISFLKQHVPLFDHKSWKPFYCGTCAVAKSTHRLARAHTEIPKESPLDLLVVVYPLKARSDTPKAILDVIKQSQVRLRSTPKALRTDNAWEFTSSSFVLSLAKLGVSVYPSLPYLPQENGEAKQLNRVLGDMAQSVILESQMPNHFWQFAYASVCFLHNRLPNSRCPQIITS
ncbi:hypothetical protein O181_007553 [Austropuccinia psidii MF-1]|uniref:Integrase catalytic domain-containing protein n=1 Tax=Austropuccinia psidii MF-1 TaxID=1389203 RepID=A0A9Q3BMF2_9BASI|nr:hypothetical protein [Austropuccinia psidii MF-1]